jgi:ribonuclease Y
MEFIIALVGAGIGGGIAFAFLRNAAQGRTSQLVLEAETKAKADAERIAREAEAAKAEAAKIRQEAEHAKAELEAAIRKAQLEADAARQRVELELQAAKQKAELDAKELAIRARQEAEAALAEKRVEVTKHEDRLSQKEQSIDRRASSVDQRESEISKREQRLRDAEQRSQQDEQRYQGLLSEVRDRLEKAAGLSSDEAKKQVIQSVLDDAKREAARQAKRIEEEAEEEAGARAKRVIGIAIQRYAGDYTCERTVTTLQLTSDEMKGRIIGREGRNIRALEAATGIDIVIDDTPEAIILSGYNPIRREVARRAIEELLKDGRIHPARIEDVVNKHAKEVEASLKEWGEKALFEIGITGVHPEIVKLLGALRYRTSYTQNQWQHALEVGFIVGGMAAELKLNVKEARRAGLMHDLGKAVSHEVEGGHAVIGADLAKKYGENERVVHAIRAHHDDEKPATVLAHLVAAGDAISGARPGARSENLDNYVKRLEELERISLAFPGVERAFAVQAGREMRVLVDNSKVSDEAAIMLSRDIARQIEAELTYP